jgi:hypothetical protein
MANASSAGYQRMVHRRLPTPAWSRELVTRHGIFGRPARSGNAIGPVRPGVIGRKTTRVAPLSYWTGEGDGVDGQVVADSELDRSPIWAPTGRQLFGEGFYLAAQG